MNRFIEMVSFAALLSLFTLSSPCISDERPAKLADVHLHWKWNQKEVTTPQQAINILRENHVRLAVVTGTPPELALELQQLAPDIVIPIYGIYQDRIDWSNWYRDNEIVGRVRQALESGNYRGIGEVHMISGFISDWKRPNISGLFELAATFDVPVLVHTEFSKADYLIGFCSAHPKTRFLWAHAGSVLPPDEVARALRDCANLSVELSARDPWRHVGRPIIDEMGILKAEWRELVITYANRIMIGSDPVWPVEQLNPWDEPDTGWQQLSRFLGFHREWLKQLPAEVAQKVLYKNAIDYFKWQH